MEKKHIIHRDKNYQLLSKIEIDQIYIINMKKDIKRKNDSIESFEKHNISKICKNNCYEFIEAVDWTKKDAPSDFKGPRNGGAYGCCMSHLKCIEKGIDNSHEVVLIMEDDLMFHLDFHKMWENTWVPNDWDILYLSATQLNWSVVRIKPYNNFYRGCKSLGGTAYILKKKMFPVIQKLYKIHKRPIDELLVIAQETHTAYVLFPNLCINFMNVSNIRKNNTWKIETTGKRLKWDISKYDKSIIMK